MARRNPKHLKDLYLIEDIKLNDDEESLIELHERYKNMFYKQTHRFENFFNINNINKQEMLNQSYFVVYDAAKSFKKDKNIKYITWLGNKTKFYFLNNSLDKNKAYKMLDFKKDSSELDELSNQDGNHLKKESSINYPETITLLENHPDKRIVKIFRERYSPESRKAPTWKNISKEFDLSSQTIINLHTKGLNFLKKRIKLAK
jgi:hypothetical protein